MEAASTAPSDKVAVVPKAKAEGEFKVCDRLLLLLYSWCMVREGMNFEHWTIELGNRYVLIHRKKSTEKRAPESAKCLQGQKDSTLAVFSWHYLYGRELKV
ncbi:hypothetical protein HPP92_011913 [Vanilla planifolia]|uniref:Uncharacterized protein n=1 Tax=Vanilla planifolia TaxID=51239 RepID=A0A835QWK7_VANPL|nr:hypothetical protein HPP92_011913 [Vanilla planifolia]